MRGLTVCKKHKTSHLDGDGCYECLMEKHDKMDIVTVFFLAEMTPNDCERAVTEIVRLREELAEWKGYSKRVLAEGCAPDEVHCTCVPALRARLEQADRLAEKVTEFLKTSSNVVKFGALFAALAEWNAGKVEG